MTEFSATDVALEGFRLTRERPMTVLWWSAAYLVLGLAQGVGFVLLNLGSALEKLQGLKTDGSPEAMKQIAALMGASGGGFLLMGLMTFLLSAMMYTAVIRAVLRPAERRFGYLRLSMDEVRQAGLALIVMAVMLIYAFVIATASGVVVAVVHALAPGALTAAVVDGLVLAAMAVGFAYPAVRLSLAPAMTFADRRIRLFRAWSLTRGRFWSLLGAYAMAVILSLILWLLWAVIFNLIAFFAAGGALIAAKPDFTSLARYFNPVTVASVVFGAVLNAVICAVTTGPTAAAFRQLGGGVSAPKSAPSTGSPWETV